jgi:hypothetical protein
MIESIEQRDSLVEIELCFLIFCGNGMMLPANGGEREIRGFRRRGFFLAYSGNHTNQKQYKGIHD